MKLRQLGLLVVGGISSLMGQGVRADTGPPSLSTAEERSVWGTIADHTALTYFGIYRGASLSDLSNSLQPTTTGVLDPTSPQSIESYLTTGYRVDKDLMIGVTTHFFYFPIGNPVGSGQSLQMWDPSLVIAKNNMIDSGGFHLTGKVFVQLPLTGVDILQKQNDAFSVSPTVIANYDVPHTSLTVGVYSYLTGYVPSSNLSDTARSYKFYVAPNANYQLTKTLAATLWVDLVQITRNRGTGFISGMSNDTADIEPGISWDITSKITFNPMINIYPSTPTLAATSLQALIIAKAF